MAKGIETTIKLRLKPNVQSVDVDYVLGSLLNLSAKETKANLVPAARKIIMKAATKGDKGLLCDQWPEMIKELNITQSQYFYILNIIKRAGIIYKSKGRFYISKTFAEHMTKFASTMNGFLMDLAAY